MCLLLILLLLTPLAAPPVFSVPTNQDFMTKHVYTKSTLVNCDAEMNPIYTKLNIGVCIPCNCFILGDSAYPTNVQDVNAVCTASGGKNVGGNDFESKKKFRFVECHQKTAGLVPPKCEFKTLGQNDIRNEQITLTCDKKTNLPIAFEC